MKTASNVFSVSLFFRLLFFSFANFTKYLHSVAGLLFFSVPLFTVVHRDNAYCVPCNFYEFVQCVVQKCKPNYMSIVHTARQKKNERPQYGLDANGQCGAQAECVASNQYM